MAEQQGRPECDRRDGRPAMHTSWQSGTTTRLCCSCHVAAGKPPADWHLGCMEAVGVPRG